MDCPFFYCVQQEMDRSMLLIDLHCSLPSDRYDQLVARAQISPMTSLTRAIGEIPREEEEEINNKLFDGNGQ